MIRRSQSTRRIRSSNLTKRRRIRRRRSGSGHGLEATIQSIGSRFLTVLLNAATGIVTARALHAAGRGELAAIAVWPNFLASAMTLGLPSALLYHSRIDAQSRATLLRAALPLALALGLIATAIGVFGVPFWLAQYPPDIIHAAQLFMLNAPVSIIILVARAACEAQDDFFGSSISLCLVPLSSLLALISIQLSRGLTPVSAGIGYLAGGIPACIWLLMRVGLPLRRSVTSVFESTKRLLGYGVRSYGVDLCGTFSLYADQVLVIHLLSPASMGAWVVALSLSRVLNIIHAGVATVAFPKAIAIGRGELMALTSRATRISNLLALGGGAVLALLGPLALPRVYGRDYAQAARVLELLIIEVVLTGATLVLTQAFMALGRPGLVTIVQSSGLLLALPLLLLLVPQMGITGAGLALLIASLARLVITLCSFPLVLRLPVPPILPTIADVRFLIVELHTAYRRFLISSSVDVASAQPAGRFKGPAGLFRGEVEMAGASARTHALSHGKAE